MGKYIPSAKSVKYPLETLSIGMYWISSLGVTAKGGI